MLHPKFRKTAPGGNSLVTSTQTIADRSTKEMAQHSTFDTLRTVFAEQEYFYRHAMLRDAAYGLLPPSERALLHGFALDALEAVLTADQQESHAFELALHAQRASEVDPSFEPRCLALFRKALDWSTRNHRHTHALAIAQAILAHRLATTDDRILAGNAGGNALRMVGRYDEALALLKPLADELAGQESRDAVRVSSTLATVLLRLRDPQAAVHFARNAAICRKLNDHAMEARSLANLALTYFEAGDPAAQEVLKQAHEAALRAGDNKIRGVILGHTARLLHHNAAFAAARDAYEAAIAASRACDDRISEAVNTSNLAELLRTTNDPAAAEFMERALRLANEVDDRMLEMNTLSNFALLLGETRQHGQAVQLLEKAYRIACELGDLHSMCIMLSNQADLLVRLGSMDRALQCSDDALAMAARAGDAELLIGVNTARGAVFAYMGRREDASSAILDAWSHASTLGSELQRRNIMEATESLARAGMIDPLVLPQHTA